MFRKWAGQIRLDWNGAVPFSPGAQYRFIIPNELVNFVVSLVRKSHTGKDPESVKSSMELEAAKLQAIEEAKELRKAIERQAASGGGELPGVGVADRRTFSGLPDTENL